MYFNCLTSTDPKAGLAVKDGVTLWTNGAYIHHWAQNIR